MIHVALTVSDLAATKRFYVDGLGYTYHHDFTRPGETIENHYFGRDGEAEIQFRYDPEADVSIDPSGIDHLAIGVDDVDAEFERIVAETECPVVTDPTTVPEANARVAFIEDPDGYVVELVEELDDT